MHRADYRKRFGDRRLESRGELLSQRLFRLGSRNIQTVSFSRSEQKGFYRLLRNEKISENKLIDELSDRCSRFSQGKVLLAIQDTTEINLGSHFNRIDKSSGIGLIDSHFNTDIGFKLHPSLVVDASNCFPVGFSSIRIWNRPMEKLSKNDAQYKNRSLEEKESYKWLETTSKTRKCLQGAEAVIVVQDREGDIYEQFLPQDGNVFMLIRSRVNRRLNDGGKLWERLEEAPLSGTYTFLLDSDSHSKEPARQATIEVRYIETQIKSATAKSQQRACKVYALEAREVDSKAREPICWRLLTTWPVTDFQTARTVIGWYSSRWIIEEVFRLLKKEGFDLEGTELESPWAIRKLAIMLLDTVLKILQMHISYQLPEEGPALGIAFDTQQQECLKAVNKKAEGKTTALQNPYKPTSLKWAAWIIARTGGWKGYKSQRKPGMTTLWKGIQRFNEIYEGWCLNIDVGTR